MASCHVIFQNEKGAIIKMKEIIKISIPKERFRQKVKQVNGDKYSYRVILPADAGKYKSQVLLISEDFCKEDLDNKENNVMYFYADRDIRLSKPYRNSEGKVIYSNTTVSPKELYEAIHGKYQEPLKRYKQEEIDFIKTNVSVLDFLQDHAGFSFTKQGQHYYRCHQHDSLIVDTKKNVLFWNSMNCHGSAIDYLEKIEKKSFPDAMKTLEAYHAGLPQEKKLYAEPKYEQIEFKLPEASRNQKKIYEYLCDQRKIDRQLVKGLVDEGLIYLDNKNNCVFKCKNYKGIVDSAFRRSTYSYWRGDVGGGNKFTGFFIESKPGASKLVMTEAYIDGLSYITMKKLEGKEIDFNVLCADSCSVMEETFRINYLTRPELNQNIDTIILASDNDKGGLNAAEGMKEFLKPFNRIKNIEMDLPSPGSDWNNDLMQKFEKVNDKSLLL